VLSETEVTFYYRETYERCLKNAGFSTVEWIEPPPLPELVEKFGEKFMRDYLDPPVDVILHAVLEK
jgi:hypothetical protein